jgi:hypothetical protein
MSKFTLILILIAITPTAYAQYSNYYNVDLNSTINKSVHVSGRVYEHRTISTIDYGALKLANAQEEKNRLESIKYANEQQKLISLEVAAEPLKAFEYGFWNSAKITGEKAKINGLKKFTMSYNIPHNSLFIRAGSGRIENVSIDGITTEIIFMAPVYNKGKIEIDVEKIAKLESVKIAALNEKIGPDGQAIFVHKKDIHRVTVFGLRGFNSTIIWEDNYQYTITDNYIAFNKNEGNGIHLQVKVRYYGDKDKVTFEQLEGRKYYLQRLVEKVIATGVIADINY